MTILQDLAANGALRGAELRYAPEWLPVDLADELFATLRQSVPWETHRIRLFGRWVDSPRLSCWIGDAEAAYTYSGTRFEPHPWPAELQVLRCQLANELGCEFNSVLANRYRDGRDCMGWHSDNEVTLGARPVIASVSRPCGTLRSSRAMVAMRVGETANPATKSQAPISQML